MLQIKIWFQNRRTKWKRKYTNDLEILAQQYYNSMGVMAPRPIFLGDRLWFFNYPHTAPQHQGMANPVLFPTAPNFMPHHGHPISPLLGLPPPTAPPQHCLQSSQTIQSNFVSPHHHGYQHMGLIPSLHQPSSSQFSGNTSHIQGVPGNPSSG
ncbi:hypothetical protein C0J52_24492 [Blattella germanica]|nr:hypothetical protein C0J52_24492 [Blattella germanica]